MKKKNIQFWVSVALVIFGSVLVAAGFIVAPLGEIHTSVVGVYGEILTLFGAIAGIDYRYFSHKQNSKDNNEEV